MHRISSDTKLGRQMISRGIRTQEHRNPKEVQEHNKQVEAKKLAKLERKQEKQSA